MSADSGDKVHFVQEAFRRIYGELDPNVRGVRFSEAEIRLMKRMALAGDNIGALCLISRHLALNHEERFEKMIEKAKNGLSHFDDFQKKFKDYVWADCDELVIRMIAKSVGTDPVFQWNFVMSVAPDVVIMSNQLVRLVDADNTGTELPLTPFQYLLLKNWHSVCELLRQSHRDTIGGWWKPITDYGWAPNIFHLLALTEAYHSNSYLVSLKEDAEHIKEALNYQDELGLTPLHTCAVRAGIDGSEAGAAYQFIRQFIKLGADRTIKTRSGHTPLELFDVSVKASPTELCGVDFFDNEKEKETQRLCRWMFDPKTTIEEIEDGDLPTTCPAIYRDVTAIPTHYLALNRFLRTIK